MRSKESGQAFLVILIVIAIILMSAIVGFLLGQAAGIDVTASGTSISNCDLSEDGMLLTFMVGEQKMKVNLSRPLAKPANLSSCTGYNTNGHGIDIYNDDQYFLNNVGYQNKITPAD